MKKEISFNSQLKINSSCTFINSTEYIHNLLKITFTSNQLITDNDLKGYFLATWQPTKKVIVLIFAKYMPHRHANLQCSYKLRSGVENTKTALTINIELL